MMFTFHRYDNASIFLDDCKTFLNLNETENNLIYGLVNRIARGDREATALFLCSIKKNAEVVGCVLRTDLDKPLSMTRIPHEALDLLNEYLVSHKLNLAGMVGEEVQCEILSELHANLTNRKRKLLMHQGVYETDEINLPHCSGVVVKNTQDSEKSDVINFIRGFIEDCFPETPKDEELEKHYKYFLNINTLYILYRDDEALSMAAVNRETENTSCISYVYTPKKHRGNGYGSYITALISQRCLENGKKMCNLYTDLLNPTSNSIYQKIGYKMIGKSIHYEFSSL